MGSACVCAAIVPSVAPLYLAARGWVYVSVPVLLQTEIYHEHPKFVDGWKRIEKNKIELVEITDARHCAFLGGQVLGSGEKTEDVVKEAVRYRRSGCQVTQ